MWDVLVNVRDEIGEHVSRAHKPEVSGLYGSIIAVVHSGGRCSGIKGGLFLVSKGLHCATESLKATGSAGIMMGCRLSGGVQATTARIREETTYFSPSAAKTAAKRLDLQTVGATLDPSVLQSPQTSPKLCTN